MGAAIQAAHGGSHETSGAKVGECYHMKTIHIQGNTALVEHNGRRAIVPVAESGDPGAITRGIPYGLPWELIIGQAGGMQGSPRLLADRLHELGIWTGDDLRARPQAALGAIQAVYGLDLAALLRAARQYEEEHNGR